MTETQAEIERHVRESTEESAPPMLKRLADFYLWVRRGCCFIRDASARLVAMAFRQAQLRVLLRMFRQAAKRKPIRVVVGKSRKTGISTLVQVLFVFLGSMNPLQRFITLTHTAPAAREVFGIAVRCANEWTVRPPSPGVGGLRELYWLDIQSEYSSGTAGGVAVGAGGTPSGLHLSEVAKWAPVQRKEETEYNATSAVPDNEFTVIVYESTFKGRDLFFDRYDAAERGASPYVAEFLPWWMDPTLSADPGDDFVRTRTERHLAELAKADGVTLSDEMLAWRRMKIASIGEIYFRQEYPSTVAEAIQATKGLILPMMRRVITSDLPFDPESKGVPRIGGIDFGYSDPTVIWSGYLFDSRAWFDQVYWGVETLAGDQVQGLRDRTTYFCDPSALAWRKELQRAANQAGVNVKLIAAPRRKNPGEDVQTVEMRRLIDSVEGGRIRITPEAAEDLLVETDTLSWNKTTGKPDMTPTPTCYHFDRVMALVYANLGAFRSRSVPETVGTPPKGKGRSFKV